MSRPFTFSQAYAARRRALGDGYRSYDSASLQILTFIDRASALGFSLAEVCRLVSCRTEERRSKTGLVQALEAKLAEIDAHLAEVHARHA
ncbi:MerR family DNA-binding protein [Phenylobacterium sp.]|uniref:MerR family DNA-binding protein n=1 Tax=Phenylobacterium sp. TaxID=1871053 RepID=UPI0035267120